jgi:hypothetical protein
MRQYFLQLLIAFDQLVTALLGGWADETLSSYAWRMELQRKPWGRVWRPAIDAIARRVFGQVDHCRKAYDSERIRSQAPPETRGLLVGSQEGVAK